MSPYTLFCLLPWFNLPLLCSPLLFAPIFFLSLFAISFFSRPPTLVLFLVVRMLPAWSMHNAESQIGYYDDFHFYCQSECYSVYLFDATRIRIHLVRHKFICECVLHISFKRVAFVARHHPHPLTAAAASRIAKIKLPSIKRKVRRTKHYIQFDAFSFTSYLSLFIFIFRLLLPFCSLLFSYIFLLMFEHYMLLIRVDYICENSEVFDIHLKCYDDFELPKHVANKIICNLLKWKIAPTKETFLICKNKIEIFTKTIHSTNDNIWQKRSRKRSDTK